MFTSTGSFINSEMVESDKCHGENFIFYFLAWFLL